MNVFVIKALYRANEPTVRHSLGIEFNGSFHFFDSKRLKFVRHPYPVGDCWNGFGIRWQNAVNLPEWTRFLVTHLIEVK